MFVRRNSSLLTDFAAQCHSPRLHTLGKPLLPADIRADAGAGLRPRCTELGREMDFPPAPLASLANRSYFNFLSPLTPFSVQLFPPQPAVTLFLQKCGVIDMNEAEKVL